MKYRFTTVFEIEVNSTSLGGALAEARKVAERIEATGSAAGSRFRRKAGNISVQFTGRVDP